MKKLVYLGILLLAGACSESDQATEEFIQSDQATENSADEPDEPIRVRRDSIQLSDMPASNTLKKFNGSWFSIEYPSNFKASPMAPAKKFDNYEFIETDEARFTSPDGTVEFFVYSPQWGGNPIDYLTKQPNEVISSDKTEKSSADDMFAATHHWVTFDDKEGKYSRAYHSQKSESTHLVFGVKYSDPKAYERFKAAYMDFKKSLQQYAD